MARKTKAELAAEREAEQAQQVAVARATYTQRLMTVLARATKENFELEVVDQRFKVENRDDRRATPYMVYAEWTVVSDMSLFELEMAVELKEEERTVREQKAQVRASALSKLTQEERAELGL